MENIVVYEKSELNAAVAMVCEFNRHVADRNADDIKNSIISMLKSVNNDENVHVASMGIVITKDDDYVVDNRREIRVSFHFSARLYADKCMWNTHADTEHLHIGTAPDEFEYSMIADEM